MKTKHIYRRLIPAVFSVILLAACNGPASEPTLAEDTPTEISEDVTEQPPTATPAPFKEELVLCTLDDGDSLAQFATPAGSAIHALAFPRAAQYGTDYTAEAGDLIVTLPTVEDGTLERTQDGTVSVTLTYNSNLVWSDGEPFKLDDVLLGLKLESSPYAPTFEVVGVEQVGDFTLKITAAPGAEYPYVPSQPALPAHIFNEDNLPEVAADYGLLSGPQLGRYLLASIEDGAIVFTANSAYPGNAPEINRVRMRFLPDANQIWNELVSGGCDVALEDVTAPDMLSLYSDAVNSGQVRISTMPGSVVEQVILNSYKTEFESVPYFADVRVRQAVAHAVDAAMLASQQTFDLAPAMDSWLPAEHYAYAGGITYGFDLNAAASLLDQAGWVDANGDGIREYHGSGGGEYVCQRGAWALAEDTALTPRLIVPAGDDLRGAFAEHIRANLAQIGVQVQVDQIDAGTYFSHSGPLQQREFDIALVAAPVRPDPGGINRWVGQDVYLHPLEMRAVHRWELEERWLIVEQLVEWLAIDNTPTADNDFSGQNYAGWCNEAANLLLVEASRTLSINDRQNLYAQQQAIVSEEVPVISMFQRPHITASAAYVCGPETGAYDTLLWNIGDWYFDESGACAQ